MSRSNPNPTGNQEVFFAAAKRGDLATVIQCVENGANVNDLHKNGRTALIRAAGEGHTEVVKFLLSKGASTAATSTKQGWSTPKGWTALQFAIDKGHLSTVKTLLEGGANPNVGDEFGNTLELAAQKKGRAEIIRTLIKHGAKPNHGSNYGKWSALMYAAKNGDKLAIGALLDGGENINCSVSLGNGVKNNPLILAIRSGNKDAANLIIKRGGKVWDEHRNELEEFLKPYKKYFVQVVDLFNSKELGNTQKIQVLSEIMDKIQREKLDPQIILLDPHPGSYTLNNRSDPYTLMNYAAQNKMTDLLEFILKKGAVIDFTNLSRDEQSTLFQTIRVLMGKEGATKLALATEVMSRHEIFKTMEAPHLLEKINEFLQPSQEDQEKKDSKNPKVDVFNKFYSKYQGKTLDQIISINKGQKEPGLDSKESLSPDLKKPDLKKRTSEPAKKTTEKPGRKPSDTRAGKISKTTNSSRTSS